MAIIKNDKTGTWEVRTYYKDFTGKRPQEATYRVDKTEFFSTNNSFRVVIKNDNYKLDVNGSNAGSSDDPINDPIKLSKYEQAVVDCIMKNPNITRKEMAEKLGLCIYNWHKKLVAAGKLYNHL